MEIKSKICWDRGPFPPPKKKKKKTYVAWGPLEKMLRVGGLRENNMCGGAKIAIQSSTTVNPNTLWSQFQAYISRMVGRINTGTSALS